MNTLYFLLTKESIKRLIVYKYLLNATFAFIENYAQIIIIIFYNGIFRNDNRYFYH